MADMTGVLTMTESVGVELPNAEVTRVIDLNFGATANASMLATGVHNIMALNQGEAVVSGYAVVTTTCTSTSNNGTIAIQVGSDLWTAAYTADGSELAAGDVIQLSPGDLEDTDGKLGYAAAADDTLDFEIGTNAFTAGRIMLFVKVIKVSDYM